MLIKVNSHLREITPFQLADLNIGSGKPIISLAQNESAIGPSPKAIEAGQQALLEGHLYPDVNWKKLCEAIADVHNLESDKVLCGCGSMELICAISSAYLGPGDNAVSTEFGYLLFRMSTRLQRADVNMVREVDLTVDVDSIVSAVNERTKVVFIANPGNPTGTCISSEEVIRLRDSLPENVLLVLDEAYGEFVDIGREPLFHLVERDNTVVIRTFSKAYALAGLRVGWGVFPDAIASEVRKVVNPGTVTGPAIAMATAAIRDQQHMHTVLDCTFSERRRFTSAIRALGLVVYDSHTNFVLIQFPSDIAAASADEALHRESVVMRAMTGTPLGNCLRATIAEPTHMELAEKVLADWASEYDLNN